MKIANLEFPDRSVFLAPMEDVTDIGFRLLCRQFGADMVYTEFVSSDALIREIKKTKRKILFSEEERPVGIQIYGSDPDTMVEAAKICEEADPDLIDINFGCPVRKIAGKGAGSGMMRTPDVMLDITEKVVKAVNKPVSVKTRLGWDDDSKIIVRLAEQLQDCGIVALTIHGRTRSQMYKGEADWSLIRDVKNNPNMHIPIIGNGDVTSPEITKKRFDETGVDAIMVGRGSIGAPWIFEEIKYFLENGEHLPKKSFTWYLDVLKQHVQESVNRLDEMRGILHTRRHLAATPLFKGIPDFKSTRIAMLRANTLDELYSIMDEIPVKFEEYIETGLDIPKVLV
ncbi:MAG: tRNA dihydrouridine synthase DusB [Fermentimonas sp.]|jgi:nifR3 family TIM-barrel protein|nr:tRNA dihydrouridine synthase DusB [Fermentimonas sp.]HBT86042.1 tRNA dihydrouridine synthase DusB [Porphyromonadaceae bacterium]MDD2931007.1 tRNA dihydrouridine synthase DusB [Fermentimonas sp.]MDD3188297.1 tRNA dihydrouridine synthase DusB [Fermentimonas sp.]MDD3510540.1 tRNA dihydrouridine synthase DusB [Fermentimonas sp.]